MWHTEMSGIPRDAKVKGNFEKSVMPPPVTYLMEIHFHLCLYSPSSINWYRCKLGAKQALHMTH